MAMIYFVFYLLICSFVGYTFGAEYMETKADFIKTCQKSDPRFVACSTESAQLLYNKMATGIEGLEGLQLDPLKLNKTQILGDDGPVSINTTLTKAVVTGFSNTVVVESKISPIDFSWVTKLYLPKMRIEGHYNMQGRILVLPLNGHGKCWFEATGVEMTIYTKTHLYEKFNHIFYKIIGVRVDFKLAGLKLRLYNLFDGNNVLEDSVNQYFNENWRQVAESLKPIISKSIANRFAVTSTTIFSFIPAEYFVSDIPHPSELYGGKS